MLGEKMTPTATLDQLPLQTNGRTLLGELSPSFSEILTPEAQDFIAMLERCFGSQREYLLTLRQETQKKFDQGWLPDFPAETAAIREGDWKIAGIPADLQNRQVEITGPTDRKMVINALNSGANAFMADFEDSNAPSWENMVSGQVNLRDAAQGTITYTDPKKGKHYQLTEKPAVLIVRPRGWHLVENHFLVDGKPISASLFDFGLYLFHNAKTLVEKGTGPYFYLPKIESRHEAALWNQVFVRAQEALGLPQGTIKVTVLIETLPAAFEMDEILYELRDHIVALNCGRWDYIFSFIKKFRHRSDFVLPERNQVTMMRHFLRSYSLLAVKTCHRRGALAMGGMAAQIPIKADPEANAKALGKVKADKEREVEDGHDGTWVAHPALVAIAREVFDTHLTGLNQLSVQRDDVTVTAADLLTLPEGTITESGLRNNIRVGILYLNAWLDGSGCVPLYHLMEDAATAEICRAQIWQWLKHQAQLDDGRSLDLPLFQDILQQEIAEVAQSEYVRPNTLEAAIALFTDLVTAEDFEEFLTLPAYQQLIA
jgi:malate synthase